MFDLPVGTKEERKAAAKFRQFLLKDGYYMMQFSVYIRLCNSIESSNTHQARIMQRLPKSGSVRALLITERQFESMKILCGEKIPEVDEYKKKNKVLVL